jgi:hypothetical protein
MRTLFRWLLDHLRRRSEPTPQAEMTAFLENLRTSSPPSMAGHLAAAALARKTLAATQMVSIPFPADILAGDAPLDGAAAERLTAYALEMRRFKARCLTENTTLTLAVARGLDVWIPTMWAGALSARAEGKQIWALLSRGDNAVESAYRFMLKREPTEVERGFFTYRPRIFLD